MNNRANKILALAACALLSANAVALEAAGDASAEGPLMQGPYLAPMGSYILTDDEAFDNGIGGTFAAGYRRGGWAIEGSGVYGTYGGANGGEDTDVVGGTINGLVFPFKGLPNLFALIGAGGMDVDRHPVVGREYSLTTAEGGMGYLLGFSWGRYEFGIRADARYRYGKREKRVEIGGDLPIPTHFADILFNLGLQLPLSLKAPTVATAPESTQVAPPTPPPVPPDTDGDGVTDDVDQCPGTPAGAKVDAKGCELPPPPPPCKTPEPGERVSLAGCGTGEKIVLRGVNFELNGSRLTADAKIVLDGVAQELVAHPDIRIEIGGHTDSTGSDAYNQRLSEARAKSVLAYLGEQGVAANRLTAIGYGESQSVADNNTEEGRALNRRVELKLVAGTKPTTPAAPEPQSETKPIPEGPREDPHEPSRSASPPPADSEPSDMDWLLGDKPATPAKKE